MKIPFFHYTHLDNLNNMVKDGKIHSRACLPKEAFKDISIDRKQEIRDNMGLLGYIPMFPGFYGAFRSKETNYYLQGNYDDPRVQNRSFYGSLHNTLRQKYDVDTYARIIVLLINDSVIYKYAEREYIRLFSNIAIKSEAEELPCGNKSELIKSLNGCLIDESGSPTRTHIAS